ncbi:MAG: PBP1A family penicillin-binding protein [candidate division KSB1 bacterium]
MNPFSPSRVLSQTAMIVGGMVLLFAAGIGIFVLVLSQDLPDPAQLERYQPKLVSKVYSADGKLIKEFFEERRSYITLDQVPKHMVQALLATEDRRFYQHWGVNIMRVAQAVVIDVAYMEKRQGASTITQQLSRLLYLSAEKTIIRKIKEILTAVQIERTYTKPEILEMYLNHVYLGHGAHGVELASQRYYGKAVAALDVQQAATLVAIVQRPESLSPIRNPQACKARRNLVLRNMYATGALSKKDLELYASEELGVLKNLPNEYYGIAPYFTEHIRQLLWDKYGRDILTQGLTIYTTVDTRAQFLAERAVAQQLQKIQVQYNKRVLGKREHLQIITQAMLDSLGMNMRQVLLDSATIHGILSRERPVQAALVCIEPKTGFVRALVGGRDFEENKYNRVIQAKRQPGSAFKPFVYTTVIANGYSPTQEVLNQPVVVKQVDGTEWRPHNYDNSIGGYVTLREALYRSLNLPTVRVVQQLTNAAAVVQTAKDMGLTTELLPYDAVAALGAGEVIPLEITSAYSALANQGVLMSPIFITRIEDRDGNVLEEALPRGKEVLSKETAYIMTHMLRSVMDNPHGTAAGARSRYNFYRPAAGKTGTTNTYRDAWFIGYTPQFVTGVWTGFDRQDMNFERGTGAVIALPIWAPFMRAYHDTLRLPVEEFERPETVAQVQICKDSKKIANDECPTIMQEVFKKDSVPTSNCTLHRGREKWHSSRNARRS